jgi:hypothetical protein
MNENKTENPNTEIISNEKATRKSNKRTITKRVPLALQNKIDFVGADPNYHYHIASDIHNNIDNFLLAGYEIVKEDEIDLVTARGTATNNKGNTEFHNAKKIDLGKGQVGYVLKVPLAIREEDQKFYKNETDHVMEQVNPKRLLEAEENQRKKEGIRMSNGTRAVRLSERATKDKIAAALGADVAAEAEKYFIYKR